MIKEKHDKGPDKEEPGCSDKSPNPQSDVRIKKEDESGGAAAKKDQTTVKNNGTVIGSTNTGTGSLKEEESAGGDAKTPDCLEGGDFMVPQQAPEGIQPLASNVIAKTSTMEVQYMQQQSQIFVFSTLMANAGADEVLQGRYPSIIAYHCAQPGTKKYLEKNPLKVGQFHRQNPAQWLNNLAMMKNKSTRSPGLKAPHLDNFEALEEIGLGDAELPWEHKNDHLEGLEGVSNGLDDMDNCSPALPPSLQGVKVPDENLTPKQRQHREDKLATIRKMQQMLFPENQTEQQQQQSAIEGALGGGGPPSAAVAAPPPGPPDRGLPSDWSPLTRQQGPPQQPQRGPVPVGPVSGGRGGRVQGPPPPYHQTPRSASVPIALQSPSPASPNNNPTSNLSLPSPRASSSSALNSPAADPTRQFGAFGRHPNVGHSPNSQDSPSRLNHSNPGTPVSAHLSPSVSNEPTSTHSSDGMFGRTLQSMAQQKINTTTTTSGGVKEPNLMPVPSPQQIQYLNTFEGQELIIQKQPNTSLKERPIISPPILPTTMDSGFPPGGPDLGHRLSGPNTPTSMDVGGGGRFPPTPGVPPDGCRFQIPSPHTPTGDKAQRLTGAGPQSAAGMSPHHQTAPGPPSDPTKTDLFPTPSPHMMDVSARFPAPNGSPGAKMGTYVNVSPSASSKPAGGLDMPNYCARAENVPLNPNCTSMGGNAKVAHFDPISSLAQMSQQLTNSAASSLNGQGGPGDPGGMMNFGSPSMHMMEMGACHPMADMDPGGMMGMGMAPPPPQPPHGFHPNAGPMVGGPIRSLSPKLPGAFNPNHMPMPRMMGRPPSGPSPYNGANVQVKPNAPNTIQYLPAKPQQGNMPPRGPPSLDFLPRYPTPMMDGKMVQHAQQQPQMQYFANNGPMQGPPQMQMPPHMDPDGGMMGPMGNGPMMGGNMGMMPMMRTMRAPPGMIRMPPPQHQMGFNGPNGGPEMFSPGPPPNMGGNPQMFVGGPKSSPMGMAPDASQPLPPSMGQNNTFKNSPFVGPTTNDPTYAQQYHHFQRQLYATNPRGGGGGQMGQLGPGPPQPPPHSQQPTYFNPK